MSDESHDLTQLRAAVDELREQVAALESRIAKVEGVPVAAPVTQARQPLSQQVRAGAGRQYVPRAERPPRKPSALEESLKKFLTQGNLLNKFGALFLIVGAGLVFKYAVDNNLIGETGRVALGLVTGLALFGAGEFYVRKEWNTFASGLVGAGNGIAFLAVYFGQKQYEVIPAGVAFGLYVLLTATVVAQSLRYNNVALAVWGLLGGYLTPALASTGSGNYVFLSCYLLILNSGVFAVAYHRNWQTLKWMAFLLTQPYIVLWVMAYDSAPNDTRWLSLNWILPFLGAFFLYFAAIPTWRSILKREPIDVFGQALTVVNGIAQFSLAAALLYDDHRAWLGIIAVLVTALYAGIASQVVRQRTIDPRALRIFTGTAAGFLLLATPYLAKGHYITLVWCAETVFLAWACTRDRFSFLRLHVVAMLFIVCVRLAEYDGLFSQHVADPNARYIPFITPESFTPLLAVLSFGAVAYFLQKVPNARFPGGLAAALGLAILAFAVNDDAYRLARYTLAPHETRHLWVLIRGGLLIFTVTAVWFAALRRAVSGSAAWIAAFALTVLLSLLSAEALIWPGSYSGMRRVLGNETGLWWLHTGTLLMSPLLLLFAFLVRQVPESTRGFKREHIQALCFGAGVVVVMLLLRREMFAVTHAPPIGDLFQASAKQAGYRLLLSISYAVLGFAVYINGIRSDSRMRIFVAYALYTFTTAKVYFFDMESQHPLYGAFAVIALGAILIVSSYFAGQHRNRYVEATT